MEELDAHHGHPTAARVGHAVLHQHDQDAVVRHKVDEAGGALDVPLYGPPLGAADRVGAQSTRGEGCTPDAPGRKGDVPESSSPLNNQNCMRTKADM